MKVAVHTLGCKVNLYESEYIINLLKNKNYSIVDFKEEADIYIINTCSVTNEADKKDRQLITRTRKKTSKCYIGSNGVLFTIKS